MAKRISKRARQKLFLQNFEETLFCISSACKKTGISRFIYYHWQKKDDWFQKEFQLLIERDKDLIEKKIRAMALGGNCELLKFYAKCKMKDRGFNEYQQVDVTSGGEKLTSISFAEAWKIAKERNAKKK